MYFLTILEAGKSKIMGPASDEGLLAVSFHGGRAEVGDRERQKGVNSSFYKEPTSSITTLIHSQGQSPHGIITS